MLFQDFSLTQSLENLKIEAYKVIFSELSMGFNYNDDFFSGKLIPPFSTLIFFRKAIIVYLCRNQIYFSFKNILTSQEENRVSSKYHDDFVLPLFSPLVSVNICELSLTFVFLPSLFFYYFFQQQL